MFGILGFVINKLNAPYKIVDEAILAPLMRYAFWEIVTEHSHS